MREKNREWIVAVAAALLLAFMTGCPPDPVEYYYVPELVSLSVTPLNTSAAPGTAVQFKAMGTYSNSSKRNLTSLVSWGSSTPGIATISNAPGSQGLATTTTATGSTTITASSGTISGSTMLTTSPVASISLAPSSPPSIAPGTTEQFAAWGTLADGTVQNLTTWATWTSLDTGVAVVGDTAGSKGLATAGTTTGSAIIEATYGGIPGTTTLTVSAVSTIAITPASASIANGYNQQFTATGTLEDTNPQNLTTWATWTSSNATVATVSNTPGSKGLASSLSEGTADITATFSAVTSTATLTITPEVLTALSVTPATRSMALGETQQFIAMGTFSDTSTQDVTSSVTWNSSSPSVASISNVSGTKGLATSLAQGTTTIRASLSGFTSTGATLTVTQAALTSIVVTPASASIFGGGTQQFAAMGIYTDGSELDITTSVTWNSSDTAIADISNASGKQGLATASFNTGSTNITAQMSGITSNSATLTVPF